MTLKQTKADAKQTAQLTIAALQEKKAQDIALLDLTNIGNSVADYFIICTGTSDTQLGALTEQVEKDLREKIQQTPWRKEGTQQRQWIILDYIDVVVHIFIKSARQFYDLENLWGDAKVTRFE